MSTEAFIEKAQKHFDALQAMIDGMPDQGSTSEYSQKVRLQIELNNAERAFNSVQPFDFYDVNMEDNDLWLKDNAEAVINDHPDFRLFKVQVWFHAEDDSTTAMEEYECLVAFESEQAIHASVAEFNGLLSVDDALFPNIGDIEELHPKY